MALLVIAALLLAGGALALMLMGVEVILLVLCAGLLPAGFSARGGMRLLRAALRARASDVVITPNGLRIEGGAHGWAYRDGMTWSEIAQERWRAERREDPEGPGSRCLCTGPEDGPIVLAEAQTWEETTSLKQLAETVANAAAQRAGSSSARRTVAGPTMLRCDGCGGPVPGDDRPVKRCGFCGRDVAVPDGVRERIRAARTVRVSAEVTPQLVQRVLGQPAARTTNATLAAGGVSMLALAPATVWAGGQLYRADHLTAATIVGLVLVLVALFGTLYALLSLFLGRRQAVALVALRLGATPATSADGSYTCRSCAAPLAAAATAVVVACDYCKAPNILGLDLRAEAADAEAQEQALETDLYAADMRRRRGLRWLGLAVVALAASSGLLVASLLV